MNLVGVLSSDETLNDVIRVEIEREAREEFMLVFPGDREILEFLNFDLPEVVIINFSDRLIPVDSIIEQIREDAWLHNFGIIGVYDQGAQREEELLTKLQHVNVLALLNIARIQSHIAKSVRIIAENRQVIFQNELSSRFFERSSGSFTFENDILASSIYAGIAATMLSQRGLINPDTKMHLQLALAELMVNAIEHGNCGVSYEEKSDALARGLSVVELVAEKRKDPLVDAKRVRFEYDIQPQQTRFVIRDEGAGFDVSRLNEKLKREGEMSLHGRGIRMAASLATKLAYNRKGNAVTMVFPHDEQVSRTTPAGFTDDEVVQVRKGDIIFREGESSNFLYYISSGTFSVFSKSRHVGMLTPADIFMGEMSFLLNNRRSATVRAEGDGKLIKISRKSFVSVIKEFPHYGIFLSKLLARKLVRANVRNVLIQQRDGAGKGDSAPT
jgi:anti-sigma regulatory factor (Ser/Thr protein kinase)